VPERVRPLLLVVLIDLLLTAAAFALFDDGVSAFQAGARYTGRVSLSIFSLILLDHALPSRRWARTLGPRPFEVLAVHHVIHLGLLLTYLALSDRFPPVVRLIGGMLAYALMLAMPWLHSQRLQQRLSDKAWTRWLTVYLAYVWFVMLMTYVARVFGKDMPFGGERTHYIALFGWVIALGLWRVTIALLRTMGILPPP
jgi:hypothetical protein